ncbi:hypothetical protein [Mycolicibacterium houstonense]|uniref:hypothetical protein n=1 Tax=Mycolicibacterium houstonense TaxID=146021 RepID=UPI0008373650|nr:hypothetical protein [Mycolicibacterium houstonense]
MSAIPRVQAIVLPLLRGHTDTDDPISILPGLENTKVGSWIEDIDYKHLPMLNVRRLGGPRYAGGPKKLSFPVIELTAYGNESLPKTEQLYEDALEVLYDARRKQTLTPAGYIHSIGEPMGATQFSSLSQSSWRIQGLIRLGIRPPN